MFLNNGKVNGTQIISKESVDAMFTPTFCALPDQSNGNTYGGLMCRYGFGIQEMSGEFEGGDCLLKDRKISPVRAFRRGVWPAGRFLPGP